MLSTGFSPGDLWAQGKKKGFRKSPVVVSLVREVEEGVFLGRFMLKIRGRLFFVFWFKLIEMEADVKAVEPRGASE